MTIVQTLEKFSMHIHAREAKITDDIKRRLSYMAERLKALAVGIERMDVYVIESVSQVTSPRTVKVNLRLPGSDLQSSDSGKQWKALIRHVEKRLTRQLEKYNIP